MTDDEAWMLFNHLFYLKSRAAHRVLCRFDYRPRRFLESDEKTVRALSGEPLASRILSCPRARLLDEIGRGMERAGIGFVPYTGTDYPEWLKEIHDPPVGLYYRGTRPSGRRFEGVSIIGTRRPTEYGKKLAFDFARSVARAGICVVSGLARGIDSEAHRGALEAQGTTVAVLGCGLDRVYPPENRPLAERIAEQGCLLSEFSPGTSPLPAHFPFRNRIISGLSRGVLVIEAARKSGTLITADSALEQGRMVWAVPGRPRDKTFEGCNRLIQWGAKPVLDERDLFEDLGVEPGNRGEHPPPPPALEDPEEARIWRDTGIDPVHLNDLLERNPGMHPGRLSSIVLRLEMKRMLKRLPGDFIVRRV
jgi:DNA processing protein